MDNEQSLLDELEEEACKIKEYINNTDTPEMYISEEMELELLAEISECESNLAATSRPENLSDELSFNIDQNAHGINTAKLPKENWVRRLIKKTFTNC